ncbi:DsbA family protein [Chitinophaga pendula]|uniref:DsbA family protein n=1 Tax=Chitinophaga TaxID=79328 RepID=UPI000BAF6BF4|nr:MULTISPECIES: DsbA family protein [Chitinophaga]ASZ11699.1 protein-disulfide isomerase [Chitinophaga sp. MD30]UCJ05285.1 DsbA family protein [Chitinophaga pendula]
MMKLIYISDALCGWCYGFTPVIQQMQQQYAGQLSFEILSGGMNTGDNRRPAASMHGYIIKAYHRVEDMTGAKFGQPFLEQLLPREDYLLDSTPPALALTVFKSFLPEKAIDFAHEIQIAFNYEGQSLNDNDTYIKLIKQYDIDPAAFIQRLQNPQYLQETNLEFQQVAQWGITGFPAVILQKDDRFFLAARGYVPAEQLQTAIEQVKTKE